MKNFLNYFRALALALALPASALADDEPLYLSILTGSENGTYYQIGKDLLKAVYPAFDLEVLPSQGSLVNIMFLGDTASDYDLAIAQADVLESKRAKPLGADKLRIVFPLYREELHVLARPGIHAFSELEGKKVAVDISGSGTHLTGMNLLEQLGVRDVKLAHMRPAVALNALRKGKIDALFFVIGAPAPIFEKGIEVKEGIHLLGVPVPNKSTVFQASRIEAGTYPWQLEAVDTVAISALLLTRDYGIDDPRCAQIGKFMATVASNVATLREKGHPKLHDFAVDLGTLAKLPRISPCALGALHQE